MKEEKNPPSIITIVAGLLLLLIVLLFVYIFSSKIENIVFYYIILVVLSLGAALITQRLAGSITYKGDKIKATGPIAVFVVVLITGTGLQQLSPKKINFTVFLRNPVYGTILKNEGKVLLRLEDIVSNASIDEYGQAQFKGIPSSLKGQSVYIELMDANKYVFGNGSPMDTILLENDNITLPIQLNPSYCTVSGKVLFNDLPAAGTNISIGNLTTKSDADGKFSINICNSRELFGQEEFELIAQKGSLEKVMHISILTHPKIILENQ